MTAPLRLTAAQVIRYRARVGHLDRKLPAGSFAEAAWGGLQDSVPRAGVISLHARVEATKPDSWDDPSVVQIWFRGGADYIVPRVDAGIFTLGSFPRDPEEGRRLERLADEIHRVTRGETLLVRDVTSRLRLEHPTAVRSVGLTGRAHIRWDASNIWLVPVERPAIDAEDARRELARRFVHWFGPTTVKALTRWTGVKPRDAMVTWKAIEDELDAVEVAEEERFALAADVAAMREAKAIRGVRLLPYDDPLTKVDTAFLVADAARRESVFPATGQGVGHIPGSILVDGEVVGSWQRQQRKVTLHPWSTLPVGAREEVEREALAFPIAGTSAPTVRWA